jgi:serine/threonine protein kinase
VKASARCAPAEEEDDSFDDDISAPLDEEHAVLEGYYAKHFVEVKKLGRGSFGGVYLCRHVMEGINLGLFAIKKIPIGNNLEYFVKVLREVRLLERVKKHPNVVEYHHSWIDYAKTADFGPVVRCLFILLEYATEGSLEDYLHLHGRSLPDSAVWYFFLSAVAGTAHLHSKGILHRDLKPQNLLISRREGEAPRVLVSDFGTAALLHEVMSVGRTGGTGTVEYMAPELLPPPSLTTSPVVPARSAQCEPIGYHTKATDVWALGMTLYYMACGCSLPIMLPSGEAVVDVERQSPFPRSKLLIDLIRSMLSKDPQLRPSCHAILMKPEIQEMLRIFNNANDDTAEALIFNESRSELQVAEPPPLMLEWPWGRRDSLSSLRRSPPPKADLESSVGEQKTISVRGRPNPALGSSQVVELPTPPASTIGTRDGFPKAHDETHDTRPQTRHCSTQTLITSETIEQWECELSRHRVPLR